MTENMTLKPHQINAIVSETVQQVEKLLASKKKWHRCINPSSVFGTRKMTVSKEDFVKTWKPHAENKTILDDIYTGWDGYEDLYDNCNLSYGNYLQELFAENLWKAYSEIGEDEGDGIEYDDAINYLDATNHFTQERVLELVTRK